MRKIIALFTALVVLPFALSACGSTDNGNKTAGAHSAEVTNQQPVKEDKPVSLNGTWKAEGFEATIADNSIEINFVNGDTSALYWKGTFPAGQEVVNSTADRSVMDKSLMASRDSTKTFNITGDTIDFKMSAMGTTRLVHLKKV